MSEPTGIDAQLSDFHRRSFATKRTKKLAGLIESAPPLRADQIEELIDQLRQHPVLDDATTAQSA